jgi:hypothetical protein
MIYNFISLFTVCESWIAIVVSLYYFWSKCIFCTEFWVFPIIFPFESRFIVDSKLHKKISKSLSYVIYSSFFSFLIDGKISYNLLKN